jgi:hypothetical protein
MVDLGVLSEEQMMGPPCDGLDLGEASSVPPATRSL